MTCRYCRSLSPDCTFCYGTLSNDQVIGVACASAWHQRAANSVASTPSRSPTTTPQKTHRPRTLGLKTCELCGFRVEPSCWASHAQSTCPARRRRDPCASKVTQVAQRGTVHPHIGSRAPTAGVEPRAPTSTWTASASLDRSGSARDASADFTYIRDGGRYGSFASFDDHSDESSP
jgi:hypothetical protein